MMIGIGLMCALLGASDRGVYSAEASISVSLTIGSAISMVIDEEDLGHGITRMTARVYTVGMRDAVDITDTRVTTNPSSIQYRFASNQLYVMTGEKILARVSHQGD